MIDILSDCAPRRGFIKKIAGVAAVIPTYALATAPPVEGAGTALPAGASPASAPAAASALPDGYQFFSAGETAFVEALVMPGTGRCHRAPECGVDLATIT